MDLRPAVTSTDIFPISIYQKFRFVQDADSIILVLDDGFNLVQYAFKLRSSGAKQTLVECQVGPASLVTFHHPLRHAMSASALAGVHLLCMHVL